MKCYIFRECPTLNPQDKPSHPGKVWGWGARKKHQQALRVPRSFTRDLFSSTWGTVPWLEHLPETFPTFPSACGTTTELSAVPEKVKLRICLDHEEYMYACICDREHLLSTQKIHSPLKYKENVIFMLKFYHWLALCFEILFDILLVPLLENKYNDSFNVLVMTPWYFDWDPIIYF